MLRCYIVCIMHYIIQSWCIALHRITLYQEAPEYSQWQYSCTMLGRCALCCVKLHYVSWIILYCLDVQGGTSIMQHYYAALCQRLVIREHPCCSLLHYTIFQYILHWKLSYSIVLHWIVVWHYLLCHVLGPWSSQSRSARGDGIW